MSKKDTDIAFWGTPPPPIGGMTVHIGRLSNFLRNKNWRVTIYNFTKHKRIEESTENIDNVFFWYIKLLLGKSPKVHYVITTQAKVRFLASLLTIIRRKKVILRVGGRSLERGVSDGFLSRYMNIFALRLCSAFIGVNSEICNIAKQYIPLNKIFHIPGFIPPNDDGSMAPVLINEFFRESDIKIVVTGQVVDKSEEDIYGLWDILKLMVRLKENDPKCKIRCCVVSYSISGDNTIAKDNYVKQIKQKGLLDTVLFYHSESELWPILKIADIFIRPSYTDGDANSIREALYLDKVVLASDCVNRPKDCILFETGNIDELMQKVVECSSSIEVMNNKADDVYKNLFDIMDIIENI